MKFDIVALRPGTGERIGLSYDNATNELTFADGAPVLPHEGAPPTLYRAPAVAREHPTGKTSPRTLKISLGLSCNYECDYCSQRFVPRAGETNKDDIEPFLDGLDAWVLQPPQRIEFWGGEPLVYLKTLRPLAQALRLKYPHASFGIITNGSLLNPEVNEWLERMGFGVGISHDGPGQHVRRPDPLADPDRRASILDLYRRLAPKGRISFNAMLNARNTSRAEIQRFFVDLTGDASVRIGEGAFVDAYDDGGLANSLGTGDAQAFRNRAFAELRSHQAGCFMTPRDKINGFIEALRQRRPAAAFGQKCGMDREDQIAVDLKGNVLTCQNVSAVGVAPNGESHRIGHVENLSEVKLTTATHWSHRKECPNCPVLALCQGACMFLEGPLWEASCDNAFSDNIVFFATAIEHLTGYAPIYIDGPQRKERKDIFGLAASGASEPPARRVIPIVALQSASV